MIIEKTKPEDVTTDIMPMLFFSFDGSTIQVQVRMGQQARGAGSWNRALIFTDLVEICKLVKQE